MIITSLSPPITNVKYYTVRIREISKTESFKKSRKSFRNFSVPTGILANAERVEVHQWDSV